MRAEEVRAILDGIKTQTRRVVKGAEKETWQGGECGIRDPCTYWNIGGRAHRCPYGQPGDRLWVRETFIHEPAEYDLALSSRPYREASTVYRADTNRDLGWAKWSPSIHMPRNLSRITLEVVSVRVERLQDISEEDAISEGMEIKQEARIAAYVAQDSPGRMEFWDFWKSIHGPDSWAENPWVWAVEFRRLEDAK